MNVLIAALALLPVTAATTGTCGFTHADGRYMETILDVGARLPDLVDEFGRCNPATATGTQRQRCVAIATELSKNADRVMKAAKPLRVSREMTALKEKFETALAALTEAHLVYVRVTDGRQVLAALERWQPLWKAAMDELDATEARYTAQCR